MKTHATTDQHTADIDKIMAIIGSNEAMKHSARQRLILPVHTKFNPHFTLVDNTYPLNQQFKLNAVRQPFGNWLWNSPNDNQTHIPVISRFFSPNPALSGSPTDDYRNGEMALTITQGWTIGHYHWISYALDEQPAVLDYFAGLTSKRPDSYAFFGGKEEYRAPSFLGTPDGAHLITSRSHTVGTKNGPMVPYVPDKGYIFRLHAVHIDDTEMNSVLHGQEAGLTTVFAVRP